MTTVEREYSAEEMRTARNKWYELVCAEIDVQVAAELKPDAGLAAQTVGMRLLCERAVGR